MTGIQDYLSMQKNYYNNEASTWSLQNKNPVVGAYHVHNEWKDYDEYLFKGFDTKDKIALEYGCGPARNLIRFHDRFKRIDGVDISPINIEKARINLEEAGLLKDQNLYVNNGLTVEQIWNSTYDVVFSVICLQHICCHEIRLGIFKEIFRILKPGGYFCAQMGFGGRRSSVGYYTNEYGAQGTNGVCDVSIENEDYLKFDLTLEIGFENYQSDLRPVCSDEHAQWIWFQVQKP